MSKTESQISYGNRISQFGFTDMFGQSKPQANQGGHHNYHHAASMGLGRVKSDNKGDKKPNQGTITKQHSEMISMKQGQMLRADEDFT